MVIDKYWLHATYKNTKGIHLKVSCHLAREYGLNMYEVTFQNGVSFITHLDNLTVPHKYMYYEEE